MSGQRFWIAEGRIVSDAFIMDLHDDADADADRFNRDGAVRVTTGDLGTEIKWSVFSPCFASLFYAIKWLPTAKAPVVLRFYLAGWFEETYPDVEKAINRIEQVLAKCDLHIKKRTFVEQVDPTGHALPPMLEQTWLNRIVVPETAVDCVYEPQSGRFRVSRIGSESTMAKLYGITPISYPCINGGAYDETVSEAYSDVLDSGKPRYDHVLAALRMSDNVVRWVSYQRIVLPKHDIKYPSVSVVAEIADVDINLI